MAAGRGDIGAEARAHGRRPRGYGWYAAPGRRRRPELVGEEEGEQRLRAARLDSRRWSQRRR